MALKTVKSIETALSLIDSKKENLKKAFEELQSHSALLPSLTFSWPDLESYFSSVQSELQHEFSVLKSLESSQEIKPETDKKKNLFLERNVPARPELKSLCENMDASGLRKYLIDRPKEKIPVRVELADAFKHAPNPGMLVLDSLEGFCDENLPSKPRLRTVCVLLLEELMRAEVEIGPEARERARAVAADWKVKFPATQGGDGGDDDDQRKDDGGLARLGYLQLLATYKLCNDGEYDANELIDYAVSVVRYRQAVVLCRILGLGNKISEVIQRLIVKGKQLAALKFIFEFGLTDEFPPVPLLKSYVFEAKQIAQKDRKSGKKSRQSLNAAVKEINALKLVIKCIEDHGLDSQYPKDTLQKRIEILEKEKADLKRPAAANVPKPQQQQLKQPKQNGNKRTKTGAGPSALKWKNPVNSVVPPPQPASAKRSGLFPLPDNAATYVASPAGAYGIAGSLGAAAAPYVTPSADLLYGLPGAPPSFFGNLNPAASNPYPPETHAQPIYYDRAIGHGGYDIPPQYHPVYYPQ